MDDIIEKYIKICIKEIKSYIRIIFRSNYKKEINDKFLDFFIKERYFKNVYDEIEKDKKITNSISNQMVEFGNELLKEYPNENEYINKSVIFYNQIYLFDNVFNNINFDEVINKILELRNQLFNVSKVDMLNELKLTLNKYHEIKLNYLNKFKNEDFKLSFFKYDYEEKLLYNVNLKYTFEFPEVYNKKIILRTYNTTIIAEDKMKVLSIMLAYRILKNIIIGNFKKNYVVEFPTSILKKKSKLDFVIGSLKDSIIQEVVYFKLDYKSYMHNKDKILELINLGFKFAIVLDDAFECDTINLSKLQIFNYIFVKKESDVYNYFLGNLNAKYTNILII